MVDLHLHTTISDGRLTPSELVDAVARAGVRVMAVTDHDTIAGTTEVRALAAARAIHAVSGIEVTAVEGGRDVHVLGYFLDVTDARLADFLTTQRERRIERVRAIASRLDELGLPVDVEPLVAEASRVVGRSIGRPQIAGALVRAGHASSIGAAFEAWLAEGRPAFVSREGPSCEAVIEVIHAARGLASLAHPAKTAIDARIPALCEAGLDALEAYHSDHAPDVREHYRSMATTLGVLVSGGSDFHGDPQQGRAPGGVHLPEAEWVRLEAASSTHA